MNIKILGMAVLAVALAACGSSSDAPPPAGFTQPAGTVAVNFTVDDTANKVWKSGELEWKGSMKYDSTTRTVTLLPAWLPGPWAKLYDDGPWTTGGHEPEGSTAGDNKLGVTVFITPPATGTATYEYGLRDATNPDVANGGWVWSGANGKFDIVAGAPITTPVTAQGLSFPAKGSTDLQLTIDTKNLGAGTWDKTRVAVKGSAWGWSEIVLVDDGTKGDATAGDGIYTMVLSQQINLTKPPYPGLTKSGDKPEFIFTFGPASKEYKDGSGIAYATGVTAGTKAATATTFTSATISLTGGTGLGSGNTYITVP
jgi:hypothetical protein